MPETLTTYCRSISSGTIWKINFIREKQEIEIRTVRPSMPSEVNFIGPDPGSCIAILDNQQKIVAIHIRFKAPEEDDGYRHLYFAVSNPAAVYDYRMEE